MRDLGSAAEQHWAVSEADGDIGAAADPWRAVANGFGGHGVHRRAVGGGRPQPKEGMVVGGPSPLLQKVNPGCRFYETFSLLSGCCVRPFL